MTARNLCTTAYLSRVGRQEPEAYFNKLQEPYTFDDAVDKLEKAPRHTSAEQHSSSSAAGASEEVSTVAASSDGPSEWSAANSEVRSASTVKVRTRPLGEDFSWDDIRLGHRFQPHRHYAHCTYDIHVLAVFLELGNIDDINGDAVKILLRAVKLMHLCDYSEEDICSTLAHASYYFLETFSLCGKSMDLTEIGHVLVTLIFIAHVYVQDETCPLRVWHEHLFRKYCPLRTLNAAVMRLLDLRDHRLRVPDEELSHRYTLLMQASRTRGARLNVSGAHSIVESWRE